MITAFDQVLDAEARESFEDLFRSDFARLSAFLMRSGASHVEAEDAAMEAFSALYQSWHSIEYPRAWVRVVADRLLQRQRQRDSRMARREAEEMHPQLIAPEADPSDGQWVLKLLQQLPPKQQRVMAFSIDGFTPTEIAQVLDMPPDTVRSHLRHARRTLADLLTKERLPHRP